MQPESRLSNCVNGILFPSPLLEPAALRQLPKVFGADPEDAEGFMGGKVSVGGPGAGGWEGFSGGLVERR